MESFLLSLALPSLVLKIALAQTHCCAVNFASCHNDAWCNTASANCAMCNGEWIPVSGRDNCIPRWDGCNDIPDDSPENPCCGAAECVRYNQWWKGCDVPENCCSWDFKNCGEDEWCNTSAENCAFCGDSIWIDALTTESCLARWETCHNPNECCAGLQCVTHENGWKGCELPTEETNPPTPAPTRDPTPNPTPNPTPAPITSLEDNSRCCSWDLANCGDDEWCNSASENCVTWCSGSWINPAERRSCTPRWSWCDSSVAVDSCCGETSCFVHADGMQLCDVPSVPGPTNPPDIVPTNPPTASLTPAPTNPPTNPPIAPPTNPPVQAPVRVPINNNIPVEGLIGPNTASERIVIPYPDEPTFVPRSNCPHDIQGLSDWHASIGDNFSGQDISLPTNTRVVIHRSVSGVLGVVTIPPSSELIIGENQDGINLDARGFDVQGALTVGSETCRVEKPVTITLHGSRPSDAVTNVPAPTYKGISVTGTTSLHGKRYSPTWTRLAKTVLKGETSLHLQRKVNWEAGQEIILVTTAMKDSREEHQNEVFRIQAVDNSPSLGSIIHLQSPIQYKHVGTQAYQAEVGLLTRKITIQGSAADSEPTDPDPLNCNFNGGRWLFGNTRHPCPNTELTGFGGHIIVQLGGRGYVDGVELFRMGQTNVLGRYPMHFHLLGDCPDCYFRSSSVHRSYYRCISIHGTNYATVSENVAYDVTGFCYYLEDGVERKNTISFNLGAHVHLLGPEAPWGNGQTTAVYQQSDTLTLPADVTASAFYITNVDNTVVGNAASGGWSGFAFPNLPTPLGAHRFQNMRPSSVLGGAIDGNTAHSTAWWWEHAGAFYFGGALYYNGDLLEYNPGRSFDFSNHNRNTCLQDQCAEGNCAGWCNLWDQSWIRLTNTKAFLSSGVGLNSWSGRMEIVGFETHDVGLSIEALESGFWIDNMLSQCRTGEPIAMPEGASATNVRGDGFFWYDTDQDHIMTNSTFRNCGSRLSQFNQYDSSPTRGCGDDPETGCRYGTVFGFVTHSDQFNPEIMQATKDITFDNCGRRFSLENWLPDGALTSVSGRTQNWFDVDGSVSGLNEPTIIGSGLADAGLWWDVDNEVVHDQQGPLKFIKANRERGLGHFRMLWDDSQHSQVGGALCGNGNQAPCTALGYIKHLGPRFVNDNGLPVTARADVAGPVGGFGWLLELSSGAPRNLKLELIEVRPDTPMLLSIAYPRGTTFTITANAAWCTPNERYACQEQFYSVGSSEEVRNSPGNTYHVDNNGLLTIRVVQTPSGFVGNPSWFLPTYDDIGKWGNGHALPRFERGGVLLPKMSYGPYTEIQASCGGSGAYCSERPPSVDQSGVCPNGYTQTAFDACCAISNPSQCVYA